MYYFIINPSSRSGQGREVWKQVRQLLKKNSLPYKALFTRYPGHGRKLAKSLPLEQKNHTLIVIGGDGTFNEVLNGLSNHFFWNISYLPVGSGNDLARGLQLSADPIERLCHLLHDALPSVPHPLDTGILQVKNRTSRFAISSGIGYDASICYEVSHTPVKKRLNRLHLGKLVYAYAAVKLLFSFQPCDMDVEIDNHRTYHFSNVYFITGMNLPYEGGGFRFCPRADSTDGALDFIIIHNISKLKILLLFPTAYFGLHTHFKGITLLRGKTMKIKSEKPRTLHRDGEYAGISASVSFSVQKHALQFLS